MILADALTSVHSADAGFKMIGTVAYAGLIINPRVERGR